MSEEYAQLLNKQPAPSEKPTEQTQGEVEYELKHPSLEGGVQKFKLEKVIALAQQGFGYSQNNRKLKLDRDALSSERETFDKEKAAKGDRYKYLDEVDKYAEQNPAWYQKVLAEYNATAGKQLPTGGDPTLLREIASLRDAVAGMRNAQVQTEGKAQSDALETEITEFRKQYPGFEWDKKDESERDLTDQILQHGIDSGIRSFRASARDLLHKQILDAESVRAKEDVTKAIKKNNQTGGTGQTEAPSQRGSPSRRVDVKKMSYSDILRSGAD